MPTAFRPVLWTDALLKEILGSDLQQISGGDESWQAIGVSRRPDVVAPGELYIASAEKDEDKLHACVPEMFRRGAVAAIVSMPIPPVQSWSAVYRVPRTLSAMQKLGEYARQRTLAKVIGVTGSVGKTGVKDALLHILSQSQPAYANYRNANCGWGIPESLSNLPAGVRYAAFEMGMLGPGSIAEKSERVRPHVALITALAPAHLGYHGSMESIAETKADILAGLQPGGRFVVPRDTEFFPLFEGRAKATEAVERMITFGTHEKADVRLLDAKIDPTSSRVKADLLGRVVEYEVSLGGAHWVTNSLGILATVAALDADLDLSLGALRCLTPSFRRGERFRAIVPKTNKVIEVIDDSWNANPASTMAALQQFKLLRAPKGGRRVLFFGDMLELGPKQASMHVDMTGPIADAGVDVVHTVGPLSRGLHAALPFQIRGKHFADARAAAKSCAALVKDGDLVLVKGSNGTDMWRIVHTLVANRRAARSVPSAWSLAEERAMRNSS